MEHLISFFLALLVSVFTVYPLFLNRESKAGSAAYDSDYSPISRLYEKKNLYSLSVKDIELDRDMGKLSEEDYLELIAKYEEKTSDVEKRISSLESASATRGTIGNTEVSPFQTPLR